MWYGLKLILPALLFSAGAWVTLSGPPEAPQPADPWVINASIIWPDGVQDIYRPTTRFDLASCLKKRSKINQEWREAHIRGYATCRLAQNVGDN